MKRIPAFLALVICLCCERAATPATQTTASSTASLVDSAPPVAPQQVVDALESGALPEFQIVAPDSSEGDWYLESEDPDSVSPEFFVGSHVRHPSGVMVIWFDTAVRATDDHPVGRAHADSVVVKGLRSREYLGRYCFDAEGFPQAGVVGLLPAPDTTARPRLAWRFNTHSFHIDRYSIESIRCMMHPAQESDD